LCACYFCAGLFYLRVGGAEGFIEGEANGLDGDVGCAGFLEERAVPIMLAGVLDASPDWICLGGEVEIQRRRDVP
jgi:hypothetical protein